jgi:hypothetical protein
MTCQIQPEWIIWPINVLFRESSTKMQLTGHFLILCFSILFWDGDTRGGGVGSFSSFAGASRLHWQEKGSSRTVHEEKSVAAKYITWNTFEYLQIPFTRIILTSLTSSFDHDWPPSQFSTPFGYKSVYYGLSVLMLSLPSYYVVTGISSLFLIRTLLHIVANLNIRNSCGM